PAGPDAGLTPGRSPAPPPRPPSAAPDGPRGDVLPAATRARLRGAVGPAADALRVHQDEPADALARARRADAVTVGRDVYFRRGRLRPQEERGFGLLVHEATHVLALMRPGAAWHRATGAGARAEEAEALAAERAAAPGAFPQTGGPLPGPSARSGAVPARPSGSAAVARAAGPAVAPAPAPPSASAAARAMAAPADREAAEAAPAPPPVDVQALRRELIDDVMRRLRDESERGG
ncbi:eCIS core domain-containing protein, partial [Streptomyces goshikiensis]